MDSKKKDGFKSANAEKRAFQLFGLDIEMILGIWKVEQCFFPMKSAVMKVRNDKDLQDFLDIGQTICLLPHSEN